MTRNTEYCKTLNVSIPFISRAKQNREIKGREYQQRAKIRQYYYSISKCMVLISQNKRGQNNFALLGSQIKGLYSKYIILSSTLVAKRQVAK